IVWKIRAWYPRAGTSLSAQVTRRIPVAHTQNDSETVEGSQEAFEKMLHERLRQAVRVAPSSVEISAMGTTGAIWKRRWARSRTCRCRGRAVAITPRCLNAIIVAVMTWTRPLDRCLWMG